MQLRLYLLTPILIEESRQMINQPCTFLCEEMTRPENSTLIHIEELSERRAIAL